MAEIQEGRHTFGKCNKTFFIECTLQRKHFEDEKSCIQMKKGMIRKKNGEVILQSQVKALGLQNKLGKQNIHEDMEKLFEPVTKTSKDASGDVIKTIIETSSENNKALANINGRLLEIKKERGTIAS